MPGMKTSLAARKAVLRAFVKMCDDLGRPPSVRELGEAMGYAKPHYVHRALSKLIERGMLLGQKQVTVRAKRVSAAGLRWLAQEERG